MPSTLHFLVSHAKVRDKSAAALLLHRFLPQINRLAYPIDGEDTLQDLQLFLLELTEKIPLELDAFQNDRILSAYILHSLKRRACVLHVEHSRKAFTENTLDIAYAFADPVSFENSVLLLALLQTLSARERALLYWIYFYGYTCTEISRVRCISVQAVSKAKRKALKKLHHAYAL